MTDMKETLKMLILTGSNPNSIRYMIGLAFLEEFMKFFPQIIKFIRALFVRKVQERVLSITQKIEGIPLGTKHEYNRVCMTRDWKNTRESLQETNMVRRMRAPEKERFFTR